MTSRQGMTLMVAVILALVCGGVAGYFVCKSPLRAPPPYVKITQPNMMNPLVIRLRLTDAQGYKVKASETLGGQNFYSEVIAARYTNYGYVVHLTPDNVKDLNNDDQNKRQTDITLQQGGLDNSHQFDVAAILVVNGTFGDDLAVGRALLTYTR